MKTKKEKDVLARFADFDVIDFMSRCEGYDIRKVASFKDELRKLCESAGLLHIGEKRWAGEEFIRGIHDDSDTVVDRLIALIVHEKIQLEKEYEKK